LSRASGEAISARNTLEENGVRDGDAVLLARTTPELGPQANDDLIAAIPESLAANPAWTHAASRVMAAVLAGWCGCLAMLAFFCTAPHHVTPTPATIAAAVSATAASAAVRCDRSHQPSIGTVTLGAFAVLHAATAGYLAVPGAAVAPKLMLAGAMAAALSLVMLRCISSGTTVFTAFSTFGMLSTITTASYLLAYPHVAAIGAVLAAAAVALLAAAARIALATARLRVPELGITPDSTNCPPSAGDDAARRADAILSGIVCGAAAAAALGASLATAEKSFAGMVFAASVGIVLLMRAATHRDRLQTAALVIAGAAGVTAAFLRAVQSWPGVAHWIGFGVATVAAIILRITLHRRASQLSPVIRRCVEIAEYGALAAVFPLACWVCGVFSAARGLHLS
jgi:type VII secretion integral membrane protein EccD